MGFNAQVATDLQQALLNGLLDLKAIGKEVQVQNSSGNETIELHPYLIEIKNPMKRTLLYPKRGNNPLATLAEILWVLAGRNDVEWLEKFLPRARDFSDDGEYWRAGYGPRLRNWEGRKDRLGMFECVDQIQYVIDTLTKDPQSRRGIISIWDPAQECVVKESKDFPCCGYAAFTVRDGKLDCTLTMRSNDVVWGFSSINMYEFTVMQEIIAGCIGVEVGTYYHFANSFHTYKRHWDKNEEMIKSYIPLPDLPQFKFYCHSNFEMWSNECVEICDLISNESNHIDDLTSWGRCIYNLLKGYLWIPNARGPYEVAIGNMPFSDLKVACWYWYKKNILKQKCTGINLIQECIQECK